MVSAWIFLLWCVGGGEGRLRCLRPQNGGVVPGTPDNLTAFVLGEKTHGVEGGFPQLNAWRVFARSVTGVVTDECACTGQRGAGVSLQTQGLPLPRTPLPRHRRLRARGVRHARGTQPLSRVMLGWARWCRTSSTGFGSCSAISLSMLSSPTSLRCATRGHPAATFLCHLITRVSLSTCIGKH